MRTSAVAVKQVTAHDVLDALRRAPSRPLTEEERSLLAELNDRPVAWLSHEELMSAVRSDEQ